MPPRDLRMFMYDVLEACRAIEDVSRGHTLETYRATRHLRSSIEREFITIGEALRRAGHVEPGIEDLIPQTPQIIAFRNNLVHRYEVVDDAVVWQIVIEHVASLRLNAQRVLDQYSGS